VVFLASRHKNRRKAGIKTDGKQAKPRKDLHKMINFKQKRSKAILKLSKEIKFFISGLLLKLIKINSTYANSSHKGNKR